MRPVLPIIRAGPAGGGMTIRAASGKLRPGPSPSGAATGRSAPDRCARPVRDVVFRT
jgi:hypothetical protein